ncbi:YSIRK-targeted surface antigen transcriptional regulator [compost metagenome]
MKLYVKNMVCDRCKLVVRTAFEQQGLHPVAVELGEVELAEKNIEAKKPALLSQLRTLGFDLIDDRRTRIVEQIKKYIIQLVHSHEGEFKNNLSVLLSNELHHEYSYLSNLFSTMEGTTIEKYFIAQKIERVKELLAYDELSLSEIAERMHYSSLAYLSNQFKKVTGFTPGEFKQTKTGQRKSIDQV